MKYDVVSVGSATLDLLMRSDSFKIVRMPAVEGGVAVCEVYGRKTEVDEGVLEVGGSGTNTAVSFARKELRVACVSEIGDDLAGKMILESLRNEGVDSDFLVVESDEDTAVASILVSSDGERSVMVHRGASGMLEKRDFPWDVESRWIHVGSLGGNVRLLRDIFKWAKKNSVRISFNPGSKEIVKKDKVLSLLSFVEVLFLNRKEAVDLFGVPFDRDDVWRNDHCPIGAKVTVVTDGKNGGKMCVDGKCVFWEGSKVKVVDTTGAGDAFASGFVSGVLYGLSYERALEWGKRNAGSVVKYMGAKKGLLRLAEIKS